MHTRGSFFPKPRSPTWWARPIYHHGRLTRTLRPERYQFPRSSRDWTCLETRHDSKMPSMVSDISKTKHAHASYPVAGLGGIFTMNRDSMMHLLRVPGLQERVWLIGHAIRPPSPYDAIHDSDEPVWLACNSGRSAKHSNRLVSMYLYITCLCMRQPR
jgi:hypothetical protein